MAQKRLKGITKIMLLQYFLILSGLILIVNGQDFFRGRRPDCRLVRCGAPTGCAIEDTFTPRGQCCPVCRRGFDKPGRCPPISSSFGICVSECSWDSDCPGRDKCCSNGCGQVCTRPVYEGRRPRCYGVICPLLRCPYGQYTPPGRCCPVCRRHPGPGGVDCSAVSCLLPRCSRPFTPPGRCCPVCPRRWDEHFYD